MIVIYLQNKIYFTSIPNHALKVLIGIALCMVYSTNVYAQMVTVYNYNTLQPIPFVSVHNKDGSFSSITDDAGKVFIKGLKDEDTIWFSHASFHREWFLMAELNKMNFEIMLMEKKVVLEAITLSAENVPSSVKQISNKLEIISADQIAFQGSATTADVLEKSGNVFIQKSQYGGGSPIIRGLEANKVLLVIDGIRLNNAIYRSGHIQNIITIDQAILQRTEVVYGPGSLIYGSDALGGVMHFYSRDPVLSGDSTRNKTMLNFYTRYASASQEKTVHADLNLGGRQFGSLTSVTLSDFNDLVTGNRRRKEYPDFGKRFEYVAQSKEGKDVIVANDNVNRQVPTGYSQVNITQKFLFKPSDRVQLGWNIYLTTSSNIPRYDKLNEYAGDVLKWALWDYGPQHHLISSISLKTSANNAIYDNMSVILSFQDYQEERMTRKFQDPDRITRTENLDIATLNANFVKQTSDAGKLIYGLEGNYNFVDSRAKMENMETGELSMASTRYPDGGSILYSAAAYLKYKHILSNKFIVSGGLRYSYVSLESRFSDTTFYVPPQEIIDINTGALTGSAEIIYYPSASWQINFMASSGFRAPNVDDYGKVFEKNGIVVVPNDQLESEYAYNFELGISKNIREVVKIEGNVFVTKLDNAIVRRDFTLNGQDSILYDGEWFPIQANMNANQAMIAGVSINLIADITRHISFKGTYNYTVGMDTENDVPLAHIPPEFGLVSLVYNLKKFQSEFVIYYNTWKRLEDYASSSEDNLAHATEDGMPSWITLNLRTAYSLSKKIHIQAALENILNVHYRTFASGVSAPGRNLIVTIRGNF